MSLLKLKKLWKQQDQIKKELVSASEEDAIKLTKQLEEIARKIRRLS